MAGRQHDSLDQGSWRHRWLNQGIRHLLVEVLDERDAIEHQEDQACDGSNLDHKQ